MIGGGLLGLEAARGLQTHGLQVDVVHAGGAPDERPARRRPAARSCGSSVERARHRGAHRQARTTAILGEDEVSGVKLRDGPVMHCDMVVVAAGIRPNTEWP